MDKSLNSKEYKILLKELYDLREVAGLTQAQLASKLNVPQSFISKYESGERRLDLIELSQICRCLGTNVKALLDKIENQE